MGSISVIPTAIALQEGFERSYLELANYDPITLIFLSGDAQEDFIRNGSSQILKDIDKWHLNYKTMRNDTRGRIRSMLAEAEVSFADDQSLANQMKIRLKWKAGAAQLVESVASIVPHTPKSGPKPDTEPAEVKPLLTKPLLWQRFHAASSVLDASALLEYTNLSPEVQQRIAEDVAADLTEGAEMGDLAKNILQKGLQQKFLDSSSILHTGPFQSSTISMTTKAAALKKDVGEWAVDLVHSVAVMKQGLW